jgi:hypothetical protein
MQLSKIIEGLTVLSKYYDKDGYHTGAEHDQFYTYATDRPVSPDDVANLKELGWFQPDMEDDAEYDPEEGWSAFT